MKKIGIFGIGCIGSILAKYLIQNTNNEYFFYNRGKKDKIKILYQNQLTTIPFQLSTQIPNDLDWILVCIKAHQYPDAIPQIGKLINPSTKVAIFRNGLNLSSDLENIVDQKNILETIIDSPIQKNKHGEYLQFKKTKITLPEIPLANDFIILFNDCEIDLIKTKKFEQQQWEKLIESSAIGSIQAMTKEPCSVFKNNSFLVQYIELINEGIEVANSEGIELKPNFAESLLDKLKTYPDSKGSSMLSDKLAGKKLELDAKIGAILKIGLNNKISIPSTQRIYNNLIESA